MHSLERPTSPESPVDQQDRGKVTLLLDSIKKTVFIFGTAFIVFIAASNSITWLVLIFVHYAFLVAV
jgi:hypothetical protein